MGKEQVVAKLEHIEEQARLTLEEFPKHLTKERLRLIIALARFTILELSSQPALAGSTPEEEEPGAAATG